ncbi:hypothetical protein DPMN_059240 [Dreissena polymorpha]|uniref:Uncharacterized protein n=1 Tax=Dreissena polymorpha TaxID=45954 RepID=A0A9D4C374_DREPO|nr:hypothetical protein DPMN_059240 [Dreissena polymorpha]
MALRYKLTEGPQYQMNLQKCLNNQDQDCQNQTFPTQHQARPGPNATKTLLLYRFVTYVMCILVI